MKEQAKLLDYEELARIVHLYMDEWCDKSLPYPNMCADAIRKFRKAHDDLKKNSVPMDVVMGLVVTVKDFVDSSGDTGFVTLERSLEKFEQWQKGRGGMMKPIIEMLRQVFRVRTDGIDIYWQSWENRTVCGHSGMPRPGDVFTAKMKSGKMGVFEVVNVRWCNDPSNMYFADVKDVGYWEGK